VFFKREQLKEWVSYAPSEFTVYASNPDHDMHIGGDHTEHVSYNSGFPFIADRKGDRRNAHFSDYINFLKLVHNTPYFNINGGVMVTPDDLPNDEMLYPVMLYTALLHTDKCFFGGMGGKKESEVTMEILKIAFDTDTEGLVQKPRICNLVSSLSPLQFDEKMLDTMLVYAAHGQPVVVSPAVMAGTTGPVTLAGTIALSHAETLVGIAVSQMIRKGTPAIYGSATANSDMKTGAFTIGSPESALAVKYCARLARMYGLPSRGGGALNDAKHVSVQAGYESMMIQFVANQEKINFNFHSAGGLDSYGSMSYEKYVTDLDILARIKYFLDDLNTGPEFLALDTIEKVGVGGEYLTQMHTAQYCRKAPFVSNISLQHMRKPWVSADDALFDKMTTKLETMLKGYERPEIKPEFIKKLDRCMEKYGVDTASLKEKMKTADHAFF
jgi:trimethylamine--corrinoid protein Co-methyltransferase